jgi:hypothetical protein
MHAGSAGTQVLDQEDLDLIAENNNMMSRAESGIKSQVSIVDFSATYTYITILCVL